MNKIKDTLIIVNVKRLKLSIKNGDVRMLFSRNKLNNNK